MKSAVRAWVMVLLVLFSGGVGWGATKKTVTVAADGSGDFKDVQAAVDSAPEGNIVVRIKPGTYEERIAIDRPRVHLIGEGSDPSQVVLAVFRSTST